MADGYIHAVSKRDGVGRDELRKEVYHDLHQAVRAVILDQAQEDVGYRAQAARDTVMMLLLQLFHGGSQGANQAQSQRDLLRLRGRELSQTAILDQRKQREQGGTWTQEL